MIVRKLHSAFLSACYLSLLLTIVTFRVENKVSIVEFISNMWALYIIYSGYSLVIVAIYGILVSICIDTFLKKLRSYEKWVVRGSLHIIFGILPGIITSNLTLFWIGGCSALIFFSIEVGLLKFSHKIKAILMVSLIPIIITAVSYGLYHPYWWIRDGNITSNEAIKFLQSGKGFYTALFPSQPGQKKELYIKDYRVTRYFKVEKKDRNKFEVQFIEEWEKGENRGKQVLTANVEKRYGGMSTGGRQISGDRPPYKDNSYTVM